MDRIDQKVSSDVVCSRARCAYRDARMKGDITLLLHAGASRSRCALHDGKQRRSVRSFSHQCIQSYALSLKRSILIPCEFNVWSLGKKPKTLLALASDHSRLIMPTGRVVRWHNDKGFGFPGLSSQSVSRFSGRKAQKTRNGGEPPWS